MSVKPLYMFFIGLFDLYKEYSDYLISFLSFSELFPAINWANEIGNLQSIWFGISIFTPCPCWFLLCAADYLLSSSGISVVSGCSFSNNVLISNLGTDFLVLLLLEWQNQNHLLLHHLIHIIWYIIVIILSPLSWQSIFMTSSLFFCMPVFLFPF